MARPMSAAEYQQHRQIEIEGALRCHKFYGLHIDRLPQDIAGPEFVEIARAALARERAMLVTKGIRRLAPSEGPQLK